VRWCGATGIGVPLISPVLTAEVMTAMTPIAMTRLRMMPTIEVMMPVIQKPFDSGLRLRARMPVMRPAMPTKNVRNHRGRQSTTETMPSTIEVMARPFFGAPPWPGW
jgi:hypothetical protein